MVDEELAGRLRRVQDAGPALMGAFNALTRSHAYFQNAGDLKTVSVSDVLDNGSIEATFQGVRIAFVLVPVLGANRRPRGRVIVMHCHCVYGLPKQDLLGAFTYGEDGVTDLDPDSAEHWLHMQSDGASIVLRFLDAALVANKTV
ncbi:hypothetical protein KY495_22655 [Massilia sp. PAMC28688]|uniref:hypothetical protein n=1 Tax=Massilia sp. PAMC28688 TaxID=2861283 RepID=UPI001C6255E1|nr:hypothetical protein [Massilia sp. PAMC28688]QYF93433.1 hypothetical protein KY495_22655 [Massilia sp. PAMC28688]